MQDMAEKGLLIQEMETCKVGMRGLYRPKLSEAELKKHFVKTILDCLIRDFPKETANAIDSL